MPRKYIFLLVLLLILIASGAAFCFWFYDAMRSWTESPPPEAYPLEQVEALMEAVESYRGGPLPNDLIDKPLGDAEKCWEFLQTALERNIGAYEIVVTGIFGDGGTPIPNSATGTTSVVIEVQFPDGTTARMDFYAATFVECRDLNDS